MGNAVCCFTLKYGSMSHHTSTIHCLFSCWSATADHPLPTFLGLATWNTDVHNWACSPTKKAAVWICVYGFDVLKFLCNILNWLTLTTVHNIPYFITLYWRYCWVFCSVIGSFPLQCEFIARRVCKKQIQCQAQWRQSYLTRIQELLRCVISYTDLHTGRKQMEACERASQENIWEEFNFAPSSLKGTVYNSCWLLTSLWRDRGSCVHC